jgi:hypothetical protein
LCAELDWEVVATVESELEINIPWFAIHSDVMYGPKTLYDSGSHTIAKKCIHV